MQIVDLSIFALQPICKGYFTKKLNVCTLCRQISCTDVVILPRMNIAVDNVAVLRRALSVLATEAAAIAAVEARLALDGSALIAAVQTILAADGRVVVTGIGKSGHVGANWPPPWHLPEHLPFLCIQPRQAMATWA